MSGMRSGVVRRLASARPAGLAGPTLPARVGGLLFLIGAAIAAVSLSVPVRDRDRAAVAAVAALAAAAAAALLARPRLFGLRELNVFSAGATGLVSALVVHGGEAASSYRFFYLWVIVYAAFFYRRSQLALQLVLVGVGYASVQAAAGAELAQGALGWAMLLATTTVIAGLVSALRERLEHLLERERERVAELLELDRLRNEIVAVVSHELRTPVASVYGAAKTLGRRGLAAPAAGMLLEVIERESERLAHLVDQILWTSRLDDDRVPLDVRRLDARATIGSAVQAARTALPPGLRIDVDAPAPVPVLADGERLQQVLDTLLENAVRYSPEGGRIVVAAEARAGRARVEVRDEGIGIDPRDHERIFRKFERLDPQLARGIAGSGLGLYIARALVERMGGRIEVRSARGHGATFAFELPAPPDAGTALAGRGGAGAAPSPALQA